MTYDDYDESEEEVEEEVEEEEEGSEEEEAKPAKRSRKQKKWKDPSKPKRALSAFFIYSQANRAHVKEMNEGISFGQIARMLADQFKNLPPKEKAKWEKKAEQDKMRYQEEMRHYTPQEDPTGGGGKRGKKAKKDPNAPKKALSAYFLFSMSERPVVKEDNPEASFGDIARIISQRYKSLPTNERAKWDSKAAVEKERYQREMAGYKS